jgi:hypothetical protein
MPAVADNADGDPPAHPTTRLTAKEHAVKAEISRLLRAFDDFMCAAAGHRPDDSRRDIRRRAWALVGTIAEPTAIVREHRDGNTVVLEVVTGVPEGSGQFASHGHTLRLTLLPAATP